MPAQTTSTGAVVAFRDRARPAMMLVAWPVVEDLARSCTGENSVPV